MAVSTVSFSLIWGTTGLLLSTPITACLVVLGRHVESLNFIELLLGDKPALSPVQSFYQRILASDPDEVAFQAEILLKDMSLLDYYEEVAMDLVHAEEIILIGHGTGKSSAVGFLTEYLKTHRPEQFQRIIATEAADLSALTEPQIEEIAKNHIGGAIKSA